MASSLFGTSPLPSGAAGNVDAARGVVSEILRMANGDASAAVDLATRMNPRFAEVMRENAGKTPEQVIRERMPGISGF